MNLDSIKPVNSGTVSLEAAIAKAKAVAAANNIAPYEGARVYGGDGTNDGGRHWGANRRSRSRSPPGRRDNNARGGYNPYRDERRDERSPRDYSRNSRDRSYSPGPRGRHSSARQRSPMRDGRDHDVESMDIEAGLVGLIIGRQGENLRRVEADTKCRVQFIAPTSNTDTYRVCKITGPRAARAEAMAAINRIIDDSGMGAIARAGLHHSSGGRAPPVPAPVSDRGGVANLKDGEDCVQIMVPDRTVGLIIGRGGETIRDLQERSGCHVNIVGEQKSVNGLRPVNLIGPYAATAQAKEMIMEIVESDARNTNGGGPGGSAPPHGRPHRDDREKTQDAIYVPNEAVGMIIGKGGETIREMQNVTGCKINVSQQPQPGQSEREIELVGTRDSINQAKAAIEEKVEAVVSTLIIAFLSDRMLMYCPRSRRTTVVLVTVVVVVAVEAAAEVNATMIAVATTAVVAIRLLTTTQTQVIKVLRLPRPSRAVATHKLTPTLPVSVPSFASYLYELLLIFYNRWWLPELPGSVVPVLCPGRRWRWRSGGRWQPAPWNVLSGPQGVRQPFL